MTSRTNESPDSLWVAQLSSPRLVHAERLRGVIIGPRRVRIDVSEGLAGRVLRRHRHRGINSAAVSALCNAPTSFLTAGSQ